MHSGARLDQVHQEGAYSFTVSNLVIVDPGEKLSTADPEVTNLSPIHPIKG
jgi:hypothetical protein